MSNNFQSVVRDAQAFGIEGEVQLDSSIRSNSNTLVTGTEANNVIGRFVTQTSEGIVAVGGTNRPAGFIANPKTYPLQGTSAGTLEPTLNLPNNTQIECLIEGDILIRIQNNTGAIGDKIVYLESDGTLSSLDPTTAITGGLSPAFATIIRFTPATVIGALALVHVDINAPYYTVI